ncbi:SGNH/GDSL hydrolase family protein [Allonocardiopsis opalescens]|uniref:GDSL-like lipase/acylhydrolase family protein n=1 Tax=Allonocardiopsis opalescens TaxID=1144618 RepID=A0A2T0QCI8_9ACTN|nr:SGNH/GDSL hydrolase family protein [Allonocardiopsis opalescens]PRY01666.1 GDSL-like lipase/acylhydrolase family protein [Allonocardiopsis opalescens]
MRLPGLGMRVYVIAGASVALVLALVAVLLTLPGEAPVLRPPEPEASGSPPDWRIELAPAEAAVWGGYLALGDSYSSGDGADSYAPGTARDGGCWRSDNAYPHRVAEVHAFAGGLGFWACSGQRGQGMLDQLGGADSQLDRLEAGTSLVTLGVGGNDLGFVPVLRTCMVRLPFVDADACAAQEAEIIERMDVLDGVLAEILAVVAERAPDARVLLVGYPRLFPPEPEGWYYTLPPEDQRWMNTMAAEFNERLRAAARRADELRTSGDGVGSVEFVDTYDAFDGHEVGTDEPWLNGVVLASREEGGITVDRSSFHPNAVGHRIVGQVISAQVELGPGRPLLVSRAAYARAAAAPSPR